MAEIDPVIVTIQADAAQMKTELANTQTVFDEFVEDLVGGAASVEEQIAGSSSAIADALKAMAAAIGLSLSVDAFVAYSDKFTEMQNQLKVAGVVGADLKAVQDRLFESAQRYGVEINALSGLYGSLTQASRELGAGQEDIFKLTNSVSAALKVSGVSAESASGALLQLGQALRGGKIQAEEYNSLLDGLYPLLEAAANGSDRWKGSVAKLTVDVKNGKVASGEFFEAILRGSDSLGGKAAKATLTTAAAVTTLSNSMQIYIGEGDKAYGISEALGAAINKLAENLDIVIPAVAVLATGLGVGFVSNAVAAQFAAIRASNAILSIATNSQIAGIAVRQLGVRLLAAFGGPVGLAITAVTAALVFGVGQMIKADDASEGLEKQSVATTKAIRDLNSVLTSDPTPKVTKNALELANARRAQAKATYEAAAAEIANRKAQGQRELRMAQENRQFVERTRYEGIGNSRARRAVTERVEVPITERADRRYRGGKTNQQRVAEQAQKTIEQADADLKALDDAYKTISGAITGDRLGGLTDDPKKDKAKTRSGPTAEEIERDHQAELSRLRIEELTARLAITTDVEKRAELQRQILREEYLSRAAEIKANKEFSDAQKKAQLAALDKLYGASGTDGGDIVVTGGALYPLGVSKELAEERARLIEDGLSRERAALEAEAELVDTRIGRLEIERKINGILAQEQRARLEAQIAAGQIADAAKARANLEREIAARAERTERQGEGPLARYRRGVQNDVDNMGDNLEQLQVDAIENATDAVAQLGAEYVKLGGIAGRVVNGIIEDLIRLAIKQATLSLFGGGEGGAGGGNFFASIGKAAGSLFGGTPGRASGGRVNAGEIYRVNEGAGRGREYFRPGQSGTVIPLGQINAAAARPDRPQQITVVVQANDYFDAKVAGISRGVATPIASSAASRAGGASFAAGQQATPATLAKYQQLKG